MPRWTNDDKDLLCMMSGQGILSMYQEATKKSSAKGLEMASEIAREVKGLCQDRIDRVHDMADLYNAIDMMENVTGIMKRFL